MRSSKLIEEAVEQFATLPGIGKKTALRFVMDLLHWETDEVKRFSNAFIELKDKVQFCKNCHNISDKELCNICTDEKRDMNKICVVQESKDIFAIEGSQQFNGVYHVLGGIISPMDGVSPGDLNINSLVERVKNESTEEVILALNTTMEGDTTNYYIYKQIKDWVNSVTSIAKGVSVGDELEYTDEVTLGRSIINRTPYEIDSSG